MPAPLLKLPALYAIVNTDSHRDPREYIDALLSAGVELLQLRDKTNSDDTLIRLVQAATEMSQAHSNSSGRRALIFVNDRVDVFLRTTADGIHLGQDDMDPFEVRMLLGSRKLIGLSTHTHEQLQVAQSAPIDYAAFGPIFETRSKMDSWPTVGLEQLAVAVTLSRLPLVAIGGICRDNVAEVYKTGVRTAAVIGDLERTEDLPYAVKYFNETLSAAKVAEAVQTGTPGKKFS